jgi:hypothetical protein
VAVERNELGVMVLSFRAVRLDESEGPVESPT